VTETIFDENGKVQRCPRCGGRVEILGYRLRNTVTMFECRGEGPFPRNIPCGRGEALITSKKFALVSWEYKNERFMPWLTTLDGEPWREISPW
jgi:hypothetical protein